MSAIELGSISTNASASTNSNTNTNTIATSNADASTPSNSDTSSSAAAKLKLKRSRSGCLTCRGRHKKCDEAKPICLSCRQRSVFCEWPVKNSLKNKSFKKKKEANVNKCSRKLGLPATNYHQILSPETTKVVSDDNVTPASKKVSSLSSHHNIDSSNIPDLLNNEFCQMLDSNNNDVMVADSFNKNIMAIINDLYKSDPVDSSSSIKSTSSRSSTGGKSMNSANESTMSPASEIEFDTEIPVKSSVPDLNAVNFSNYGNIAKINSSLDVNHVQITPNYMSHSSSNVGSDSGVSSTAPKSTHFRHFDSRKFQDSHDLFFDYICYKIMNNNDNNSGLYQELVSRSNKLCSKSAFFSFNSFVNENMRDFNLKSFSLNQDIVTNETKNSLFQCFFKEVLPLFECSGCNMDEIREIFIDSIQEKDSGLEVGSGSEMTDAMNCALLALCSRISEIKQDEVDFSDNRTLRLYNKSIKNIIQYEESVAKHQSTFSELAIVKILITAVLLFNLQILTTNSKNYKPYLEKTLVFMKYFDINGFDNSKISIKYNNVLCQLFWVFVKIDLHFATCFQEPTLLSSHCLSNYNESQFSTNDGKNMNYLCYLLVRILEFNGRSHDEWKFLNDKLDQWYASRGNSLKAFVSNDSNKVNLMEDNSFAIKYPMILFPDQNAAFVNQMYHYSKILLIQHDMNRSISTCNEFNSANVQSPISDHESIGPNAASDAFENLIKETKLNEILFHCVQIIAISLNSEIGISLSLSNGFNCLASNLLSLYSGGRKSEKLLYWYDSKKIISKLVMNERAVGWPNKWKFEEY